MKQLWSPEIFARILSLLSCFWSMSNPYLSFSSRQIPSVCLPVLFLSCSALTSPGLAQSTCFHINTLSKLHLPLKCITNTNLTFYQVKKQAYHRPIQYRWTEEWQKAGVSSHCRHGSQTLGKYKGLPANEKDYSQNNLIMHTELVQYENHLYITTIGFIHHFMDDFQP